MDSLIVQLVQNCIDRVETYEIALPLDILYLDGMSGKKTRGFLNYLVKAVSAIRTNTPMRYLEIGSWKGSTFISAFYNNSGDFVSIDNWCQFNGPKMEFLSNVLKYHNSQNIQIINEDCFHVDLNSDTMTKKFDIYFYDGGHNDADHLQALSYFFPSMNDIFVYIVDDWNEENIRQSTRSDLSSLPIKVLYEKEILSPITSDHDGWWNGIYILVIQKL